MYLLKLRSLGSFRIKWLVHRGEANTLQESESVSHSVVSNSLQSHELQPSRLLRSGILQARILEWVAIPFSGTLPDRGIKPRTPASQADSLLSEPLGKPLYVAGLGLKSNLLILALLNNMTSRQERSNAWESYWSNIPLVQLLHHHCHQQQQPHLHHRLYPKDGPTAQP